MELVDASGARVLTYAHVVVLDAAGTSVPARMFVREDGGHGRVFDGGGR